MPVKSRSMFNKVKNISLLANFISELINFYCRLLSQFIVEIISLTFFYFVEIGAGR